MAAAMESKQQALWLLLLAIRQLPNHLSAFYILRTTFYTTKNLRPAPRHSVTERRCHSSARVGVARELQANTGHVVHNHSSADTAGLNHTGVHGSRQSYRRGHKTLTMRCPVSTGSWLLLVLPAVLPPWSLPAATTVSAVVCTARTTSNSNKSRITYALECRVGPGVGQEEGGSLHCRTGCSINTLKPSASHLMYSASCP